MPKISFHSLSTDEYKKQTNFDISYGITNTKFGQCILGLNENRICFLAFFNDGEEKKITKEMEEDWPNSTLTQNDKLIKPFSKKVFENTSDLECDILLKGTEMQISVWKELTKIESGQTMDYSSVAEAIGKPAATRAVATAISKNKVGYIIPCHRVIRKSGDLGNYRSGKERKEQLLKFEKAI